MDLCGWQTLPDDGRRYKIIDGVQYITTAPGMFHQWIMMRLMERFGLPAVNQRLGYAFCQPVRLQAFPNELRFDR
jgi:hypothetical protein